MDAECDGEPETCEDIGATEDEWEFGCCVGDVLWMCSNGGDGWTLGGRDCSDYGMECSYDAEEESMNCI